MHALILLENDLNISAIVAVLWCGQMDGSGFSIILDNAYREKYIAKPIVICLKGRGSKEGNDHLRGLQKEFPQIHIEEDWNQAVNLVIKLSEENLGVQVLKQQEKEKQMKIKAFYK